MAFSVECLSWEGAKYGHRLSWGAEKNKYHQWPWPKHSKALKFACSERIDCWLDSRTWRDSHNLIGAHQSHWDSTPFNQTTSHWHIEAGPYSMGFDHNSEQEQRSGAWATTNEEVCEGNIWEDDRRILRDNIIWGLLKYLDEHVSTIEHLQA